MAENYPTLRVHASTPTFSDPGTADADFQGEKFIGAEDGDHHATILEISAKDKPELVQIWLTLAKAANAETVHKVGGQWVGMRFGVWDKIAPK